MESFREHLKNVKKSRNLRSVQNSLIMLIDHYNIEIRCSTSLPGGNQVDGLPPALSFESIKKLLEVETLGQFCSKFDKVVLQSGSIDIYCKL